MPLKSATSVPGRIGRCRSAASAVSVRRGSTTTIFSAGFARLRVLDAAEQDRVREGGVRAGDEQAVGVVDVVVAGRRRVGAERLLVAGHRADMHRRELVSTLLVPIRPLASLLKT
jgi:hypothetical protein